MSNLQLMGSQSQTWPSDWTELNLPSQYKLAFYIHQSSTLIAEFPTSLLSSEYIVLLSLVWNISTEKSADSLMEILLYVN